MNLLNALNSLQTDPNSPLIAYINSPQGLQELHTLLNNNETIAYIFLKNSYKFKIDILKLNPSQFLYLNTTDQNFNFLCDFFNTLSHEFLIDTDFFYNLSLLLKKSISNTENTIIFYRCLKILETCTGKYTKMMRSNQLYQEINQNVHFFGESILGLLELIQFDKLFVNNKNFVENGLKTKIELYVLQVFQNYIFQDIPSFFEKIDPKIFLNLLKKEELKEKSCEILNLFVSRYSECFDLSEIYNFYITYLTSEIFRQQKVGANWHLTKRSNILREEKLLLLNLMRLKIFPPSEIILNLVISLCRYTFPKERLEYLRSTEKKDIYREEVSEMLKILLSYGLECSILARIYVNLYGIDEGYIFLCYEINYDCFSEIINLMESSQFNNDEFFIFSLTNYLIRKKIILRNVDFLISKLLLNDFSFFKIIQYFNFILSEKYLEHDSFLYYGIKKNKNIDQNVIDKICSVVDRVIMMLRNDDEYTSQYIFNVLKEKMYFSKMSYSQVNGNSVFQGNYPHFNTEVIKKYVLGCLRKNPSNSLSTFFLLDSAAFFKDSMDEVYLCVEEMLFEEENGLCMQLMGLMVKRGFFREKIANFFGRTWNEKFGMTILGIGLFMQKKIGKNVMDNLSGVLSGECVYAILRNIDDFNLVLSVFGREILYDEMLVIFDIYTTDKNLAGISAKWMDENKLNLGVGKCLDELLKTTVNRKTLGRLRNSCVNLLKKVNDENKGKIYELLKRNEGREVSYGNVLWNVVKEFEL